MWQDSVMIVILLIMMVHIIGALSACMLVWNNKFHDWIPGKEIASYNFEESLSNGMSG